MKKIRYIIFLLSSLCIYGQSLEQKFHLDFEKSQSNKGLPSDWIQWGSYLLDVDSTIVHSGKYSVRVVSDSLSNSFGSMAYRIPSKYKGNSVRLEGFMKTKDVQNGHAGLLLRLDGESGVLQFDNMQNQGIVGTTAWKKYSITLPYPENTENIMVAGILIGKGTVWFDDFEVFIDDKNIQTLKEIERVLSKAEMDTEFDSNSGFQLDNPTSKQVSNLFKLGKIWGFVKYHHPEIAKGNVNWDNELFRIVSSIDSENFETEIMKWLNAIGPILKEKEIEDSKKSITLEDNPDWISSFDIKSKELRQVLIQLKKTPKEDLNYYLKFAPNIGNPVFKNEASYSKMLWDDDGYKLVSLFRYWNMIEYFFPYKHLMDNDWNEVLKASIPNFLVADDELSYKLELLKLIGKIQDTHGNIHNQEGVLDDFFGINIAPLQISFIENKAVVTKIYPQLKSESKIKRGDIITKIDGVPVADLVKEKLHYTPGSNLPVQLFGVSKKLLRTNKNSVTLSIDSDKIFEEEVRCVPKQEISFWDRSLASHKELDQDIGYIYPGTLKRGEIHDIMKRFISKKALIIDLRCYPSDFIVFSLGKYLMPAPTEFVKFTQGSLQNPGQFSFTNPLKVGEVNPDYFKGKVIISINETTVSQAEYTTMALRVAPNVLVIGSTTAAADGNVSPIVLPGNIRTMISGIGVNYPDGTETQRIGITPDLEIKPTIKGIIAGKDEVLEKAIELILEN